VGDGVLTSINDLLKRFEFTVKIGNRLRMQ
jgi:hypothetical protein